MNLYFRASFFMNDIRKYVVTGGPGFGKTSIINELERRGYNSVHEISRSIIKEQLDSGGDVLPWKNLGIFSRLVFERRVQQHVETPEHLHSFFDRGVPDVVAYMVRDELELPEKYVHALSELNYNQFIFLTPPWQDIFINDNERKESYEQACSIHTYITDTYNKLGYTTLEIPKVNVSERVDFILSNLNLPLNK
jgi:predicted ATPase